MENDGDDDQGAGWCEVKKKHKTSSKLSIQKASGRSSNKTHPFSPRYQSCSNGGAGNMQARGQFQPVKAGHDCLANSTVSAANICSLVEVDQANDCINESVVDQETALPMTKVGGSEGGTKVVQDNSLTYISNNVPKFRWGDLEDGDLGLHGGREVSKSSKEDESAEVADGSKEKCGNAIRPDESVLCVPLDTFLHDWRSRVSPEAVEKFPDEIASPNVHAESANENEFPSEDIKQVYPVPSDSLGSLRKIDGDVATAAQNELGNQDAKTTQNEAGVDLDLNNVTIEENCSSPVQGIVGTVLQDSHGILKVGSFGISGVSSDNQNTGMVVSLLSPQNKGAGTSVNASVTATMEVHGGLHDGCATYGTDFGESDLSESKERFRQRLWCFLFENLNRAVDELYLLCELECDMEQIDEAILVLEEARSDFRELKCRAEHFENTKKPSSQLPKDGMTTTVKADHRRPHALSWEVRRMTTSPHRAEILSSSLEAFQKIQLERAEKYINKDERDVSFSFSTQQVHRSSPIMNDLHTNTREPGINSEKLTDVLDAVQENPKEKKENMEVTRPDKRNLTQHGRLPPQSSSTTTAGKSKREPLEPVTETGKQVSKKDKEPFESRVEKHSKAVDMVKKHNSQLEKEREKDKRNMASWKSMDAWKEKRNWEDILKSPMRGSSRASHSPGMSRKVVDRARVLHDKLMSPEKKKKSALDMKREVEERHARAMRIRNQLENERVQRLQRTSEKLNRVNEWQAVRSSKLREVMYARHQRSETRHEAFLAQVVKRAGDESSKVNEVRFITSLNEENKKLILRQKLLDSEMRRAEKLQIMRTKQKEDTAREEAVLERRKLLEAEKLQRLAETQRKKEEAQVRREEERKASSAAREARAVEQLRRKESRAKAQQEEAELLAQKLAEKLKESEQRRKFYLEQIREKASMDFRDQSSPLQRRSLNKEGPSRSLSTIIGEDNQTSSTCGVGDSVMKLVSVNQQQSLKRRIKKIRQRLMALKHEFSEPSVGAENAGPGCRALAGSARAKIGRWVHDLQRFRQARKEGAASIGLIVNDMIKFLEGKDPELHAARQAGLLDFISSALPASHTSKPEACQVTLYLLRLLRVVLSLPVNRSYFLVQNLLPPLIPMLSSSLENYIKVAASSNSGSTNLLSNKTSPENFESVAEVLDGFLWTVACIIGHVPSEDRQLQMQDGLMELIIAYQVVHRLRDLFALYDRPQVEGSPFPSSILSSLNLLAVLTSRPKTISSVDWEYGISKTATANKVQEESVNVGEVSMVIDKTRSQLITHEDVDSPVNRSGQVSVEEKLLSTELSPTDVSEHMPLGGEFQKKSLDISINMDNSESQKRAYSPSGEFQDIVSEERAKSSLAQKDDKSSMNCCAERKRGDERVIPDNNGSRKADSLKQPVEFLLSAIVETGLVSLPSLLTAVLLHANNRLSSEQACYILPSNFEEVATGVLKVLNNLALMDLPLLQSLLARSDLKMEFFHLMSFLLTHCTNKWKAANDQVGLLLLECLLLLSYFALFHPGNQAVLRWGKSPTILHKVCDLPFVFFSDPELIPMLTSTLVAACYGCDQNRGVLQQELSTEMILSLLKSSRQGLQPVNSDILPLDSSIANDPIDGNQIYPEGKKLQGDIPVKLNRRSSRTSLGKGGTAGSSSRSCKTKIQRDSRGSKTCDEWALKHNLPTSRASSTFMLHRRFPSSFLDKAEEFFSAEISSVAA